MQPQLKQCPQCGTPAPLTAASCAHCGRLYRTQFVPPNQTQMFTPPPNPLTNLPGMISVPQGTHSAATALLLSIFLWGSGQGYNKQGAKGLTIFILLLGILVFFGVQGGWWLVVPFHAAQVIDAALIAGRLNRGEAIREWDSF